jgi:hypothetical protein
MVGGGLQDWAFRAGMSKLRYCPKCEKMRWQLRQMGGGRVQHLRDAIAELGPNASSHLVVRLALKKAHAPAPVVGVNNPGPQMPLGAQLQPSKH